MNIFPEDLLPPLPDIRVERITVNPELKKHSSHEIVGSYVVQSDETKLWKAIRVKIDQALSAPNRVKILKQGKWVKQGHTAIAHACMFEKL